MVRIVVTCGIILVILVLKIWTTSSKSGDLLDSRIGRPRCALVTQKLTPEFANTLQRHRSAQLCTTMTVTYHPQQGYIPSLISD